MRLIPTKGITMLGIGLGELVLVVLLFCLAAWLLATLGKDPWKRYGLWILGIFAVIYALERLHIFELLQKVMI